MNRDWLTRLLYTIVVLLGLGEAGLLWRYTTTESLGIQQEQAACRALAEEATSRIQKVAAAAGGKGAADRQAQVHEALEGLGVGHTGGYMFVVDRKGRYVSHPIEALVRDGETLQNWAAQNENEGLKQLAALLGIQEEGQFAYTSGLGKQPSWLTFKAIPGTDEVAVVSVVQGELVPTRPERRRTLILAALLLGPLALALVLARAEDRLADGVLWKASTSLALGLALTVGVVWAHGPVTEYGEAWHQTEGGHEGGTTRSLRPIHDHEGLAHYQRELASLARREHLPTPRFVRTGVYVRTVEFDSEQDVRVGGTAWQRFRLGQDDDLRRGVRFPESISRSPAGLVEVYRKRVGDEEIVGWDFDLVIRSPKEFVAYPLNEIHVALHIWPQDLTNRVVLVPDLAAYPLLAPWARPGVDVHLVTTRPLELTQFGFKGLPFGTNFGDSTFNGEVHYPELTYVMNFRNDMLVPLVGNVLPILMIGMLLFATLMNQSKSPANWGVFGMVSGLLFSLAVAQVKLREMFETEELVYLEKFYVVLYVALAAVCLNAMLLGRPADQRPAWVAYRENLPMRLAFWPTLLLALTVVTLHQFY